LLKRYKLRFVFFDAHRVETILVTEIIGIC